MRVATSSIPNAGLGLFARHAVEQGEVIPGVTYTGRVMSLSELNNVPEEKRDYVLCFHFNVHVDASLEYGSLARYINDPVDEPHRVNAEFVKHVPYRFAEVRATRRIADGGEIFVRYGEGYWKRHRAAAVSPPSESDSEDESLGNGCIRECDWDDKDFCRSCGIDRSCPADDW